MTLDETTLTLALDDLAATVPDDPARLTSVHRRAYRLHRRHRAVGAGAIAATMAAVGVGAEVFVTSGRAPSTIQPAGAPGAPASGSPRPACAPSTPLVKPGAPVGPPAIGQQFSGGGMIAGQGTASAVTIDVVGGPIAGSKLTLAITADTKVLLSSAVPDAPDVATTADQLHEGQVAKFSATRTGAATYVLDEIHAGPVSTPGIQGAKAAAAARPATPAAVGDPFKAGGVALASTADSVTVQVDRGNLTGTVRFTLACTLSQSVAGSRVDVAGTRTSATTYDATHIVVSAPPVNP